MPSRRELIQMTPEETKEFLATQKTLIIVSNGKDGFPHPMPMWYAVDDQGRLSVTTFSKAQKVLNYQRDYKASLLVEDGEEYEALRSVMIKANAEVIDDFDTVVDTLVRISTKGLPPEQQNLDAVREGVKGTAQKRVVIRFTPIETISWNHAKLGGKY